MSSRALPLTQDHEQALKEIRAAIPDRTVGLPDPVFRFALDIVPMINVDIFVVDAKKRFLLAWRQDEFSEGWHVPGGIIRWNESIQERLERTARSELGTTITFESSPIAIAQLYGDRGHFISLLYRCDLPEGSSFPSAEPDSIGSSDKIAWFSAPPTRLYPSHLVYRDIFERLTKMGPASAPIMLSLRISESSYSRSLHQGEPGLFDI